MNSLDAEVIKYQSKGWILMSRSDNVAQLMRMRKGFSCLPNLIFTAIAVAGFFTIESNIDIGMTLLIVGATVPVIYLFGWIFHRKKLLMLTMDEQGNISKLIKAS